MYRNDKLTAVFFFSFYVYRIKGPSRDMLLAQKSMLESERDALVSMIEFNQQSQHQRRSQESLNKLQQRVNAAKSNQQNKTTAAMAARADCVSQNSDQYDETSTTTSGPCQRLKTAAEGAVGATFQHARTQSEYFSASFFLHSSEKYNNFLSIRIEAIERQLVHINEQLNKTNNNAYLGDIADSKEFRDLNKFLNVTEQNLDDEWEQFEYDSDSSHMSTTIQTLSLHVSQGAGVVLPGELVGIPAELGASRSLNFGLKVGDIKQAVNSASVKVSGEVLRVTIKRPWFKPSIFEDPKLFFVSFFTSRFVRMPCNLNFASLLLRSNYYIHRVMFNILWISDAAQ